MTPKQQIYTYIQNNDYMTLATASADGKPQAATVKHVLDGDTLLFNTPTYYRKYKNIQENDRVACVITVGHESTLQFEGTVAELAGKEADDARQKLIDANPEFEEYFEDETRFFRITPNWMRLREYLEDKEREVVLES